MERRSLPYVPKLWANSDLFRGASRPIRGESRLPQAAENRGPWRSPVCGKWQFWSGTIVKTGACAYTVRQVPGGELQRPKPWRFVGKRWGMVAPPFLTGRISGR